VADVFHSLGEGVNNLKKLLPICGGRNERTPSGKYLKNKLSTINNLTVFNL